MWIDRHMDADWPHGARAPTAAPDAAPAATPPRTYIFDIHI